MTVVEYRQWQAFYALEPFGDVRADMRSGIVAALIARTMGGRKNATPLDYMPIVAAQDKEREAAQTQRDRNVQARAAFAGILGPIRLRRVNLKRGRKH
jgi:hypothetical protein